MHREERIDQELKRLKAVQEAAQYRAEAQASRRLLEHQKSVARVSVPTPPPPHFCINVLCQALHLLHHCIVESPLSPALMYCVKSSIICIDVLCKALYLLHPCIV